LKSRGGSWKVNGKNGDATKVKEFLQKVVALSADEFLDGGASEKWESFLEVHTSSVTLRVDIGPKPDQNEKVTLQREDGSAYRVFPWRLDFLNKKGIEFLAP